MPADDIQKIADEMPDHIVFPEVRTARFRRPAKPSNYYDQPEPVFESLDTTPYKFPAPPAQAKQGLLKPVVPQVAQPAPQPQAPTIPPIAPITRELIL